MVFKPHSTATNQHPLVCWVILYLFKFWNSSVSLLTVIFLADVIMCNLISNSSWMHWFTQPSSFDRLQIMPLRSGCYWAYFPRSVSFPLFSNHGNVGYRYSCARKQPAVLLKSTRIYSCHIYHVYICLAVVVLLRHTRDSKDLSHDYATGRLYVTENLSSEAF